MGRQSARPAQWSNAAWLPRQKVSTVQETKYPSLSLVLPAGRRVPGVAPTETKGVCCFWMSQTGGSKRSFSNTPGGGSSICSLIGAINRNFIWQENVQEMTYYSKGLCAFLCSSYCSSRQMGRARAAAGVINLYHCIDLSSCPWRKDDWDFLERGQGSGLQTGRAI